MDHGAEFGRRGGPWLISEGVRAELWTSWASLLRSYAGAHGLNSAQHAVVEVGAEEILVRVGSRWLLFTHTAMRTSEDGVESFAFEEDGTVWIGGSMEEMDMAAERLARELMSGSQ